MRLTPERQAAQRATAAFAFRSPETPCRAGGDRRTGHRRWGPPDARPPRWETSAMPTVPLPGANHTAVTLSYDRDANAMLALHVASAIRAGVDNNTIFQFDNKSGTAPPVPPGETGEFIQSESGTTILPPGYDYVVDSAHDATILGNGDRNEQVLARSGNLKFFAPSGSGSIITGGGNDQVNIAASDAGDWLIAMGNGNDT